MIDSKLKTMIDQASVVSFDIFDTLLLRPYLKPEDMFLHLEKIYNCFGFAEKRLKAEKIFYQKNGVGREATLDDIYDTIPEYSEMKQRELDWELQTIYPNSEIIAVYNYAISLNKKIIICSDMYLPLSFIKNLLKQNKITKYFKIYLSNSINHRKDKGNLYEYIVKDLNVDPKAILHIGDNKNSDFIQAKKKGLRAYWLLNKSKKYLQEDKKYSKFCKLQRQSLGCSIVTEIVSQYEPSKDYWVDFGYKYAGPVVYSFARWIYENAVINHIDNILFIARDGWLLKKVFDTFAKKIKTNYVYAPRILNYTANLDYDRDSETQARIICQYYHKDCEGASYRKTIEAHLEEFAKLAAKEKEKTGYSSYIKKIIDKSKQVGIVDSISGQLSGQRLIEKEGKLNVLGFYFLTLAKSDNICTSHLSYIDKAYRNLFIRDSKCDLIELILSSPENPIITMKGGKPVFIDDICDAEVFRQKVYKKIETGVLSFVTDISKRFSNHDIYFTSEDTLALLSSYVGMPNKKDIQEMFDVKKSPNADNGKYIPLFSADIPFWKINKTRKLPWLTLIQRIGLVLLSPVTLKAKGLKQVKITLFKYIPKNIFKISLFGRYELSIGGSTQLSAFEEK